VAGFIIPAVALLAQKFFEHKAASNKVNAQNANNAAAVNQQRADVEARARAAAAIYSKVLGSYGHGDLASEEQLYNALLKEPNPVVKQAGPSLFSPLSEIAGDVASGAQDYNYNQGKGSFGFGTSGAGVAGAGGTSPLLQQIMELLKRNGQTPSSGGTGIGSAWGGAGAAFGGYPDDPWHE
jgi:hypothetical protein